MARRNDSNKKQCERIFNACSKDSKNLHKATLPNMKLSSEHQWEREYRVYLSMHGTSSSKQFFHKTPTRYQGDMSTVYNEGSTGDCCPPLGREDKRKKSYPAPSDDTCAKNNSTDLGLITEIDRRLLGKVQSFIKSLTTT